MAIQTTTFKGARYLVKFHDPIEWASTESYEAIEAVQHNAFTYISKQPVPAGVQIDNTDFWLLWADPNAQMEELRRIVSQYVDDVENLSGVVDGLSTGLDNVDAALPIGEFSSENTVKGYIDSNIELVGTVLPIGEFSAENTVKDYIDSNTLKTTPIIEPVLYGIITYDENNGMPEHPGAICDIEGTQIVISSKDNNTNGGHWRTININANADNWDNAIERTLYHSNSIAYDENKDKVYIAPVFDYSVNPAIKPNILLEFSPLGDFIKTMATPEPIMGVSFDSISKKLYAYAYTTGHVYEIDENDNMTVTFTIGYENSFNQDFAVHDGIAYISSPSGFMKKIDLASETIVTTYQVLLTASKFFTFNELDGMEFTKNGNLLAIGHSNIYSDNAICGVFELPLETTSTLFSSDYNYITPGLTTFTVVLDPQNKTLRTYSTIKNAYQFDVMWPYYGTNVLMVVNKNISINHLYITNKIAKFSIRIDSGCTFEIKNYFRCESDLTIFGQGTFKCDTPITVGTSMPHNYTLAGSITIDTTDNDTLLSSFPFGSLFFIGISVVLNGMNIASNTGAVTAGRVYYTYNKYLEA